jgi:hypothetical protein
MHTIYITPEDNARLRLLLLLSPYTDSQRSERELLRQELDRAAILNAATDGVKVIGLGAAFEYEDVPSGAVATARLCLPGDQATTPNGLSVLSRFGTAVIGCGVGNEVWWAESHHCRRILIRKVGCDIPEGVAASATAASDFQLSDEQAELQAIWAGATS